MCRINLNLMIPLKNYLSYLLFLFFCQTSALVDAKSIGRDNYCSPQILTRYSLEEYLPEIGDQGDVGSCVGWASTYYGLTVVKRIEHGRDYPVFSPLSTFNRYCFFYHKNPCYGGSQIDGSLEVLKKYGSPLLSEYALQNCAHDPDKTKYKDRLFDFERLQHMNYLQIKAAISNNRPVVVGMNVYAGGKGNSLNSKFLDSNGVIKIENFNSDFAVAGHAMCIIGYDDNIGGGSFKLVNSWGKEWGKDGFCWLRYRDLEILRVAFSLIPNDMASTAQSSIFRTTALDIMNTSTKNYYLSFGLTNADGDKYARGWYFIPAGHTKSISIGNRLSNEVYYLLMDEQGQIFESTSSNVNLPIDDARFFDSKTRKEGHELIQAAYCSFTPSNKKKTQHIFIADLPLIPKLTD